jgi:pyruvate/2-oxoglutarate/acetoin dehydrogenase E1 component
MTEINFKEALNKALDEEMARDENVFLIGEDIGPHGGVFGVTHGLFEKYGFDRVKQTPISESAIIGAAIGSSMIGLRPVAEIMYFDFAATCMDQIINQAAKIRYMSAGQVTLPMVIRTQAGAGRGKGSTHSQYLEALFFHVPGIKVALPSNPYDAKGMLKTAIRDNSPVLFIENAFLYNAKAEVPEEDYVVPFGRAEVKIEGKDLTVVSYSVMVGKCLEAAQALSDSGISAEVIDLRTVVPLDLDSVVASVQKTGRLLIVHEACKKGGIGAEIASQVGGRAFDYLDAPIMRIGAKEAPIPFAEPLELAIIPGVEEIVEKGKELVGE